ncbi:MAG: NUDIX hydrolase [Candidatus Shapirobacteria bacterium]
MVFRKNSVWLRKNERNEWELPGGKMDKGEQPEQTIVRELEEELGFKTKVVNIIQAYLYTIKTSTDEARGVLVVSYLCELLEKTGNFETEGEAGPAQFKKFPIKNIPSLKMPQFYKKAILKASRQK